MSHNHTQKPVFGVSAPELAGAAYKLNALPGKVEIGDFLYTGAQLEAAIKEVVGPLEEHTITTVEHTGLINQVYAQRNRLIIALARLSILSGYNAGYNFDPANGRAVVYIETPNDKQLSWHMDDGLTKAFLQATGTGKVGLLPVYTKKWDGTFVGRSEDWPERCYGSILNMDLVRAELVPVLDAPIVPPEGATHYRTCTNRQLRFYKRTISQLAWRYWRDGSWVNSALSADYLGSMLHPLNVPSSETPNLTLTVDSTMPGARQSAAKAIEELTLSISSTELSANINKALDDVQLVANIDARLTNIDARLSMIESHQAAPVTPTVHGSSLCIYTDGVLTLKLDSPKVSDLDGEPDKRCPVGAGYLARKFQDLGIPLDTAMVAALIQTQYVFMVDGSVPGLYRIRSHKHQRDVVQVYRRDSGNWEEAATNSAWVRRSCRKLAK